MAARPTRAATVGLCLYAAIPLGSALQAYAYRRARPVGADWQHELYWAGAVVVLTAAGGILALRRPGRAECLALCGLVGAVLFLGKLYRSPDYFNFYDELAHWRAADEFLRGTKLFRRNPLNPVVGRFPGLHALTAVVARTTGLSVFAAGNLVVGLMHGVLLIGVYAVAEAVLDSPPMAALAALLATAAPGFLYFDAQFAYESLALPLVVMTVALALRRAESSGRRAGAVGAVLVATVVVTHHASAYMLVLLLAAAALALSRPVRRRLTPDAPPTGRGIWTLLAIAAATALFWVVTVAPYTFTYLGPLVTNNVRAAIRLARGTAETRRLFASEEVPRYESLFGYAFVLVFGAALALVAYRLLRKRATGSPLTPALVAMGLGFAAAVPLVIVQSDQVAKRAWGFTIIGVATLAALVLRPWLLGPDGRSRLRWAVVPPLLAVLVIGGGSSLSGPNIRFPGPYQPSADPRSMTAEVVAAARWLDVEHGPGHRVMSDRTGVALFGSYGRQYPVQQAYEGFVVAGVFQPATITPIVRRELERSRTDFVVTDQRLPSARPLTGFYFDRLEFGARSGVSTVSGASLAKFNDPRFARIYDNGTIQIFATSP